MTTEVNNIAGIDLVERLVRHYGIDTLKSLLRDRSTGKNIIWADSEYVKLGTGYEPYDEITIPKITCQRYGTIEPRVAKDADKQVWRTRAKAEVFTPSWLCKQMVDQLDDAFFNEEPAIFGSETSGLTGERMKTLGEGKLWQRYIDNRLLEITCGEAPFMCSPYDAVTGDFLDVGERIGFLDRKLRVVTRYANDFDEWVKWAMRALEASYGYEYQGDNLVIARINVFDSFADHMEAKWNRRPDEREAKQAAKVVSWNVWQMDGLRGCAPSEWDIPEIVPMQPSLFDLSEFTTGEDKAEEAPSAVLCKIHNWRARRSQTYESLKGTEKVMKKFYGVIGNPPYQEEQEGNNTRFATPIYNYFIDQSCEVGEKVELIHPARFLTNSGSTP